MRSLADGLVPGLRIMQSVTEPDSDNGPKRARRGLTLDQLAARLGVSALTIASWIAEGLPCDFADASLPEPTPAQERAAAGLGERIRQAQTATDLTEICFAVDALAASGSMSGARAEALQTCLCLLADRLLPPGFDGGPQP